MIYLAVVRPVATYSIGTMAIPRQSKAMKAFDHLCLKKIFRIYWPDRISASELYRKVEQHLGTENKKLEPKAITLEEEAKRSRLRLLGHALRLPDHRMLKGILHGNIEGARRRGRPRENTWLKLVEEDLQSRCPDLSITDEATTAMANDRSRWRREVVLGIPSMSSGTDGMA
jgi:hypothetical protein